MNAAAHTEPTWCQTDREVCWHPYTQHGVDHELLPVVGAQGSWLELADGRRVLDAISSWWANLHGHGHPRLVQAAARQAQMLDHVLFAGCTHEPAVGLAEDLLALTAPLAHDGHRLSRVFYSDNGSTAIEVALKAAYLSWLRRGQPERTLFLALDDGYHGDTLGAMSVAEPEPFYKDFAPFLFHVERIAPDAEALATALQRHGQQIAGFILEPLVQGAAGMKMHAPEFLRQARKLCDQHGVYLIADEVMTGFGRTGTVFACEQADVCPDLMALAKGLTGGIMPLAATLASEEIYQCFVSERRDQAFFHGHTFTAHPIGCAVARASIKILREENTPQKLLTIGTRIRAGLAPLETMITEQGPIGEIRHLGGIVAIEFAAQDQGYLAGIGDRLRAACKQIPDVLLRPSGNVLNALPPACTTLKEADRIAQALCEVSLCATTCKL
jgi:adenosylmethionine---8-amino-7-oxononanoate aminotransferase